MAAIPRAQETDLDAERARELERFERPPIQTPPVVVRFFDSSTFSLHPRMLFGEKPFHSDLVILERGRRGAGSGQAVSNGRGGKEMPLYRSRRHKVIAGVCGGIADWLGWDPTLVRVAYVLISIASVGFPGTIAYVILWIVMPKEPSV